MNLKIYKIVDILFLYPTQAAGQPGVMHVPYAPAGATAAAVQQFQVNGQPSTLAL